MLLIAVATDAQAYWENHMPGPGPQDRLGPQITILASMAPAGGADGTYHFVDDNIWDVRVIDPNGHVVYENDKVNGGGGDKLVLGTGQIDQFTFRMPFGSAEGTYTVEAQLLQSGVQPIVTATFEYGWAQ
ncbi:MAG TPA: hypothetical protein VIV11_12400 [Kofleriaceae bacterium]